LVKKITALIPIKERREMVDRSQKASSIVHQCELLSLSRSTLYYTPSKAYNERDLEMMAHLERLYMEDPTRGTRRMCKELVKLNYKDR